MLLSSSLGPCPEYYIRGGSLQWKEHYFQSTKEEYFAPKESLQFSVNRLGESISIVAKEFPGNHRAILYFHDNKCLTDGSELIDNLEAHYPVKYRTWKTVPLLS